MRRLLWSSGQRSCPTVAISADSCLHAHRNDIPETEATGNRSTSLHLVHTQQHRLKFRLQYHDTTATYLLGFRIFLDCSFVWQAGSISSQIRRPNPLRRFMFSSNILGTFDGSVLNTTNGRYLTPSESPSSITVALSLSLPAHFTHTVLGAFLLIVLVGKNSKKAATTQ
jgi:hypothetical protein